MAVFLNESNQYDLSVDGMKFSVLYNQMHGTGGIPQVAQGSPDAQAMAHKPLDQGQNTQDFGFSFNPGNNRQINTQQPGPNHQDPFAPVVNYENPEKIFSNGTTFGDFKFDGFGKDAWGIYTSGNGPTQTQNNQDFFSSPFDKQAAPTQQKDFYPQTEDTSGGMWVKDAPIEPQVVEDSSKGKKGFM